MTLQFSSLIILDFAESFTECALMHYNIRCQRLRQYLQYSFFDGILKSSMMTPLSNILGKPPRASWKRNLANIIKKRLDRRDQQHTVDALEGLSDNGEHKKDSNAQAMLLA